MIISSAANTIYLDNAATTPLDQRVLAQMLPFLSAQRGFGNANSNHSYGREAAAAIAEASAQVASLIQAHPDDIVWTAGATEANNLALRGVAYADRARGQHLVTTAVEHSSILATCAQLAREGFEITYLPVNANGLIDLAQLRAALRPDTLLLSVQHVNNETGVIQDLSVIAAIARAAKVYLHVDAVQSVGKLPLDLQAVPVDLMSLSAHKVYGPKGIGALYINRGSQINLRPLLYGGGQACALRPGTQATHQIVGMGAAFALAQQDFAEDNARIAALSARFWQELSTLQNVTRNGAARARVPAILNLTFAGIAPAMLLPALKNIACSTGSACYVGSAAPSPVLRALGLSRDLIESSLRFSLGRFTTEAEITLAIAKISQAVRILQT